MTAKEVLVELESYGNENTKKVYTNHGAPEPFFGVKVSDMKKILKKERNNHELALELYKTGNSDAMYLAGLMADKKQVTKEQLRDWAKGATWYMLSEYTVPWLAADAGFGWELGLEWIEGKTELIKTAGWSALSNHVAMVPDEELDKKTLSELLTRVENELQSAENRVRYCMNNFVISVGCYVPDLIERAKEVGNNVGKVNVDMGGTACKVPDAIAYIEKVEGAGRTGKKKAKARC